MGTDGHAVHPDNPPSGHRNRWRNLWHGPVTENASGVGPADVPDAVTNLLSNSMLLLPVDHAAVVLENDEGNLHVVIATSEDSYRLHQGDLAHAAGPAEAAFRSRGVVQAVRLEQFVERWPLFVREARRRQVKAAYALPLRAERFTIGALVCLICEERALSQTHLAVGRALATLATIAILSKDSNRAQTELCCQLQDALDSRIVIEQAKGIIAAQYGTDVSSAFESLRRAARAEGRSLTDLSAEVVASRVPPRRDRSAPQRT